MILSDTTVFAIYWFAIGAVIFFPFGCVCGWTWRRDSEARRVLTEAAAARSAMIEALRNAAAGRQPWPPVPSDDAMHGAA